MSNNYENESDNLVAKGFIEKGSWVIHILKYSKLLAALYSEDSTGLKYSEIV
jgi:hypothetical protein